MIVPALLLALLVQTLFLLELMRATEPLPVKTPPPLEEVLLDLLLQEPPREPAPADAGAGQNDAQNPAGATQNPSSASGKPPASKPLAPPRPAAPNRAPGPRSVLSANNAPPAPAAPAPAAREPLRLRPPERVIERRVLTVATSAPPPSPTPQPPAVRSAPPVSTVQTEAPRRGLLTPGIETAMPSPPIPVADPQPVQLAQPRAPTAPVPELPDPAVDTEIVRIAPAKVENQPIAIAAPRATAPVNSGMMRPEVEVPVVEPLATLEPAPTRVETPAAALAPQTQLLQPEVEVPRTDPPPSLTRSMPTLAPLEIAATNTGVLRPQIEVPKAPALEPPQESTRAPAPFTAPVAAATTGLLAPEREKLVPVQAPAPIRVETVTVEPVSTVAPATRDLVRVERSEVARSQPPVADIKLSPETSRASPEIAPVNRGLIESRDPVPLAEPESALALERPRMTLTTPQIESAAAEADSKSTTAPATTTSQSAASTSLDDAFGPVRAATGPVSAADLQAGISDVARAQVDADAASNGPGRSGFRTGLEPLAGELPNRLAGLRLSQPAGFREVIQYLSSTLRDGGMTYSNRQWTGGAEVLDNVSADDIESGMSVLLERWLDKHHGSLRRACTDNHSDMSPTVQALLCDEGAAMEFERQQRK